MRPNTVRRVIAVSAVLSVVAMLSCFSDRDDPIVGVTADCSLPLAPGVVGINTTIVQIVDFAFVPAEIRVPRGSSVTWVYCEPPETDLHNSVSDSEVWDAPLLGIGDSFTFQFGETGSFPYHCAPHPFMRGTVLVE